MKSAFKCQLFDLDSIYFHILKINYREEKRNNNSNALKRFYFMLLQLDWCKYWTNDCRKRSIEEPKMNNGNSSTQQIDSGTHLKASEEILSKFNFWGATIAICLVGNLVRKWSRRSHGTNPWISRIKFIFIKFHSKEIVC